MTPLAEQDAWESRKAWRDVISALKRGDMGGTAEAKSTVERAQRGMRKVEESFGKEVVGGTSKDQDSMGKGGKWEWERCFFARTEKDEVFEGLARRAGVSEEGVKEEIRQTQGVWKVDWERVRGKRRPYRGAGVTPLGYQERETGAVGSSGGDGGTAVERKEAEQGNGAENGISNPGEKAGESHEASTSNTDSLATRSISQGTAEESLDRYETAHESNQNFSLQDPTRSNGITIPDRTVD